MGPELPIHLKVIIAVARGSLEIIGALKLTKGPQIKIKHQPLKHTALANASFEIFSL